MNQPAEYSGPRDQRLAAALWPCKLEPAVRDSLVAMLHQPPTGTVTLDEIEQAEGVELVLLAAIIALTRLRDEPHTPARLLSCIAASEPTLSPYDQGRYWHLRGFLAWRQDGALHRAYRALNRSMRLLEAQDTPAATGYLARVWDTYGQLLQHQGISGAAQRDYERALALRDAAQDEAGAALTLGNLARLAMETGEFTQAATYLQRDLAIITRLSPEHTRLHSQLCSHLGDCRLETGQPEAARKCFEKALALAGEDPASASARFARVGLARAALALGPSGYEQAKIQLELAGWSSDQNTGVQAMDAEINAQIAWVSGDLHWARNQIKSAGQAFRIALDHFESSATATPVELAQLRYRLARVALLQGDRLEGAQLLRQALRRLDATAMDRLRGEVEQALKEASREIWLLHNSGRFLGQGQLDLLLELAGQRGFRGDLEQMVILFSDIRGFTHISEKLAPNRLIEVLNDYLSHMTRCIEYCDGIVDKFIGDAIMALFLTSDGDTAAERAARAALMMQDELEHFNRGLPEDAPHFRIGIGLHTGEVVAGLIGSPQKRSYTAIGDPVNTASRLEGMTKTLGARILVSSQLADQLPAASFLLRPLGSYRPKGRDEIVEAHELMLEVDGSLECNEIQHEITRCQTALSAFRTGRFGDARDAFKQLEDQILDPIRRKGYRFLKNQAQTRNRREPSPEWHGVIELKTK